MPNKSEVRPQLFKLSLLLRFKINKEEHCPEGQFSVGKAYGDKSL